MRRTLTGVEYRREHGSRQISGIVFDACTFDNCRVRGGSFTDVEFRNCRTWSCSLDDVEMRNCVIDGLRMTVGSGTGGRTSPLIVGGLLTQRVELRGTFGSLIWNPPGPEPTAPSIDEAIRLADAFYASVTDYALDIRDAKFTSVPALRFGPPGHLIRRDATNQPLIHREEAQRVLSLPNLGVGVWRIVLNDFVRMGWPESKVLVPAEKAAKKQRERDASDLDRLREVAELS
jgi:hypothetical protein